MKIELYHQLQPDHQQGILDLLYLADQEFVPPLSQRTSSTQSNLIGGKGSIEAYFETIRHLPAVLALKNNEVVGFMNFYMDYHCPHIPESLNHNVYACTCVVHPSVRGHGLMGKFYEIIREAFPHRAICTRTWHTNTGHIHTLQKMGFTLLATLENDRGSGVHTVYYALPASS